MPNNFDIKKQPAKAMHVVVAMGICLCLAFTNKMINKVPLDRDQELSWKKADLKKKHLVYSVKKGDQVVIHLIDLKNCKDTLLLTSNFLKRDKIDLLISDHVFSTTDHFCFCIRINKMHYFKEVELTN